MSPGMTARPSVPPSRQQCYRKCGVWCALNQCWREVTGIGSRNYISTLATPLHIEINAVPLFFTRCRAFARPPFTSRLRAARAVSCSPGARVSAVLRLQCYQRRVEVGRSLFVGNAGTPESRSAPIGIGHIAFVRATCRTHR